jgi:hypothetical protein
MPRQFNPDTREFEEVPVGWERQHNAESKRWDYAPPGSVPRFLEDRGEWVLAPEAWVLASDPRTGKLRYADPDDGPSEPMPSAPIRSSTGR